MKRILVYYPSNQRTVQLETTILALHRRGAEIALLTTCEAGPLHSYLSGKGIPTYAHPVRETRAWIYYPSQIAYLSRFCRAHGITAVLSNLQHTNFIAVLAQYLMSARVVAFRHHFKFALPADAIALERNPTEQLFDKVINRLARTIVVPSNGVYNGMRQTERVDMTRVVVLPYIYDFDQYARPDPQIIASIRARFPARLTLLMSARLIPFKRHSLVFSVIRDLIREGLDLRMLVLGDGPERTALEEFVVDQQLGDRIIMLGYRTDFVHYMAASDLLIHPSLTEASSNVVKEMGLLGKTVVVCEGVGDFDDYVADGLTGFVVPRSTDGSEIGDVVRRVYSSPEQVAPLGRALKGAVLERFRVTDEVVDRYLAMTDAAHMSMPKTSAMSACR